MVVTLTPHARLLFCSNHAATPTFATGEVDWSKVRRVKVLKVEVDDVGA